MALGVPILKHIRVSCLVRLPHHLLLCYGLSTDPKLMVKMFVSDSQGHTIMVIVIGRRLILLIRNLPALCIFLNATLTPRSCPGVESEVKIK